MLTKSWSEADLTNKFFPFKMILAVLWTAFIVYALTSEPSAIPKYKWLTILGMDKVIHIILFFIETILILFAFNSSQTRPVLLAIAWCLVLGSGLEVVQHFWIEGRSGNIPDLLADAIGAVLGAIICVRFRNKWRSDHGIG